MLKLAQIVHSLSKLLKKKKPYKGNTCESTFIEKPPCIKYTEKKYSSRVNAFGKTLGTESGDSILRVFPRSEFFARIVL